MVADDKVPAVKLVRRANGQFVRLELNGQEFPPWISSDHPMVFSVDGDGMGTFTLTMLAERFDTEVVD